MNNSGQIVNLVNPTNAQDAATKTYVDTKTTDMATNASVTTALGSSGTQTNNPTIRDTQNQNENFRVVLTQETTGRANLYQDDGLTYNVGTNKLSVQTFSTVYVNATYVNATNSIGIGTSQPAAPLHVFGGSSNGIRAQGNHYGQYGASGFGPFDSTYSISIIVEAAIWVKGEAVIVTSDRRIKTNIVNLNADKMMNIFRNLRPISFDFIDPTKNNNKKHFGFIAQEVNEVLPEGISINTDVIPNNMMKGEIDQKSKIEASFTLKPDDTDITLQYLLLTTDKPISFDISNSYSSKDTYKFKVYCGKEWTKEHDIYIRSEYNVIDDKYTYVIGMKKDVYDVVITEPTLFVYGQYVYDLHILEHDTIYTVATAALQEVDRQQQADKARIAELENKVSNLETTVAAQQSLINDILERLKALEKV